MHNPLTTRRAASFFGVPRPKTSLRGTWNSHSPTETSRHFPPHLPCEISEADFRQVNGFAPDSRRLSIHFDRFSVVFHHFQSVSISLSQFNQLDSVKNAGIC